MLTSNTVEVYGDLDRIYRRIYQLAADIQDWPTLLPHYRYMRLLEQSPTHKIADFGATRAFALGPPGHRARHTFHEFRIGFPVKWRARQELFPEEGRITFRHLRGVTRGMWVEWRLEKHGDRVLVTIDHELNYPIPFFGPMFAKYIVGNLFVHPIASTTLHCFKAIVEAESGDL